MFAPLRSVFTRRVAGGGLFVLAATWLFGCAAQRATQTLSPAQGPGGAAAPVLLGPPAPDDAAAGASGAPVAAAAQAPVRVETETLATQQAGLLNLLTKIDQRAEANAIATAQLEARIQASVNAQGLGQYTSQFGVGAACVVALCLIGEGVAVLMALWLVCSVALRLCAVIDLISDGLVRLLRLDELGDQQELARRGGTNP